MCEHMAEEADIKCHEKNLKFLINFLADLLSTIYHFKLIDYATARFVKNKWRAILQSITGRTPSLLCATKAPDLIHVVAKIWELSTIMDYNRALA